MTKPFVPGVTNNFFKFTSKKPPDDWCLPSWHNQAIEWDTLYGNLRADKSLRIQSKCMESKTCELTPEELRANAETQMRALGLWPQDQPLPLDVYTIARNMYSEHGSGTPEERVAIAQSGINRYRWEGYDSITAHLTDGGNKIGNYGGQVGGSNGTDRPAKNRPAATSREPNVADILLAALVYDGYEINDWMPDYTNGGVAYFDHISQKGSYNAYAKKVEEVGVELAGTPVKKPEDVYISWTSGGDYQTWVGHIPNVNVKRLLVVGPRKSLTTKERSDIQDLGLKALQGTNRPPRTKDSCNDGIRVSFTPGGIPTGNTGYTIDFSPAFTTISTIGFIAIDILSLRLLSSLKLIPKSLITIT